MRARPERAPGGAPLAPDHPCAGCGVRMQTFCKVLDSRELARMRAMGSTGRLKPGECLFHEGDPADLVYNLTGGTLKLYKLLPDGRRQIAGFVHSGDFLGLTPQPDHAFTAEAIEPTEYCRFASAWFHAFVDSHHDIGRELYRLAAQELDTARGQMVLLGRKRAGERLASFLLDLFDRMRTSAAGRELVRLPMNRTDIADYLGLTKETVCRAFTALRKDGLIATLSGSRVELLRRDRLETLAGGGSA